jgi:hypothetical protein
MIRRLGNVLFLQTQSILVHVYRSAHTVRQNKKIGYIERSIRTLSDLFAYFGHAKSTSEHRLVDGLITGVTGRVGL